ncbi:MAG: hypothetical protein H6563_00050 [Lewinellaceae bacterium]|nr:hypothetical protein [Lewinellaceae bacterium]
MTEQDIILLIVNGMGLAQFSSDYYFSDNTPNFPVSNASGASNHPNENELAFATHGHTASLSETCGKMMRCFENGPL